MAQEFGDIEDDDVLDPTPPDPFVLARAFIEDCKELSEDNMRPHWDDLHPYEQALFIFAMARRIERLKREWKNG
jgi:hypothetical protein